MEKEFYVKVRGEHITVPFEIYEVFRKSKQQNERQEGYYKSHVRKDKYGKEQRYAAKMVFLEDTTEKYSVGTKKYTQPDLQYDQHAILHIVKIALAEIPKPFGDILICLYFKEQTQVAVAEKYGVSQPLLNYYKQKGLKLLRSRLEAAGYTYKDISESFPNL